MFCTLLICGCEEDQPEPASEQRGESALSRRERIRELETDVEVLRWENVRLSLKVGPSMVHLLFVIK